MMHRILFCCPVTVSAELGTAKVYIEAAESFRHLGWEVALVGPEEYAPGEWLSATVPERPKLLARYLRQHAKDFDVVEFDIGYLPFPRADFPVGTLLVARSVLLVHHFLRIVIPPRPGLRRWIGQVLRGRSRRKAIEKAAELATLTCRSVDLINLCNTDEVAELRSAGISAEKMVVFPFGLTTPRRAVLETVPLDPPARPCVAFVGTFDPRKGMRDFPKIVAALREMIPEVRFKFVGTNGMLKSADEVYAEFPPLLRSAIEVIPRFAPSELPNLLADCSVGVFPSSVEGFPFGVLEMLTAGLPVIAYRAPGPPMMLPDEYLVPHRDTHALASRVGALLRDPDWLRQARVWARARSREFNWDEIAARTAATYQDRLAKLRGTEQHNRSTPIR